MTKTIPLSQGKVCGQCKMLRPFADFNKSRRSPDGHQRMCRDCQAEYREATREHRAEYDKQYRKAHPEVGRRASRKYRKAHLDKVRKQAREHAQKSRRERPQQHHARDRKSALRKNYGLSMIEYQERLERQGGVCAICARAPNTGRRYLCVDHDHKTGTIRGLLCNKCNVVLGLVDDDSNVLREMISYVEAHMGKAIRGSS